MVTINRDKSFKCSHGELFETLEKAIECDLYTMARDVAKKDFKILYGAKKLGGEVFKLPDEIVNMVCTTELETILHWVMNNSHLLEELITFNLDSIVHFKKLEEMNEK